MQKSCLFIHERGFWQSRWPQQLCRFLTDLGSSEDEGKASIRSTWKAYIKAALPHALTQIRNFILPTIAEGKNVELDEDTFARKGTSLDCNLTHADVEKAGQLQKKPETVNTDDEDNQA